TSAIGWTDPQVFRQRNDYFYALYKAGTLEINEYVLFATEAARQHGAAKSIAAHADFMRTVILPALQPVACDLVQQHQDAGDQVIIVTATNAFVTRPIADALGVDELIAVDLEHGADGWITGRIQGVPSFREGKITRVEAWLAQRGLDWQDVEATFYSDSINDLALLEKVQHPIATNPDAPLRAIATQRGWRILDLFTEQP
ncbi:MAG: HAD-IB family hydrolase, partial [Ferruginibacter sp.]|nr:HAD-IB family hydrolase [Rhodoferax sp.]